MAEHFVQTLLEIPWLNRWWFFGPSLLVVSLVSLLFAVSLKEKCHVGYPPHRFLHVKLPVSLLVAALALGWWVLVGETFGVATRLPANWQRVIVLSVHLLAGTFIALNIAIGLIRAGLDWHRLHRFSLLFRIAPLAATKRAIPELEGITRDYHRDYDHSKFLRRQALVALIRRFATPSTLRYLMSTQSLKHLVRAVGEFEVLTFLHHFRDDSAVMAEIQARMEAWLAAETPSASAIGGFLWALGALQLPEATKTAVADGLSRAIVVVASHPYNHADAAYDLSRSIRLLRIHASQVSTAAWHALASAPDEIDRVVGTGEYETSEFGIGPSDEITTREVVDLRPIKELAKRVLVGTTGN